MLRTDRWERRIDGYDPERDARAIVEILLNHVFPVELRLFTELGQVRTATIPSIAKILHATGPYAREGLERVEDTRAILIEIFRDGAGERSRPRDGRAPECHSRALPDFERRLPLYVECLRRRSLRENREIRISPVARERTRCAVPSLPRSRRADEDPGRAGDVRRARRVASGPNGYDPFSLGPRKIVANLERSVVRATWTRERCSGG